jgi:hypothetical protein
MTALGERVRGEGTVYLTGGATALLYGWRAATIDVDIKGDPEPAGFFEALAALKEELDINVELASPDQFIPPLPGWRERSPLIARCGSVVFRHYDLYGQALAKLQRRHDRDMSDVRSMAEARLIDRELLQRLFDAIEPDLTRYPGIDAATFRASVMEFVSLPMEGRER